MSSKLPRVLLLVMLAPVGLSAQQPQPAGTMSQGPNPYGTGGQAGLNYSGGSSLRNLLLVDAGFDTSYDDNILNRNDHRIRDMSFRLFPRIGLHREGRQLAVALDYQPSFLMYRKTNGLNEWDQTLALDVNYQVSRQLAFRARGTLLSTRGILQPASSDLLPALGSPGNLNDTVLRPLARQLASSVRLDAIYETSRHTSFTLFGVLAMRNFSQASAPGENLLDSEEKSGGLMYRHRLSPNNTLGMTYLLKSLLVGVNTRVVIHSGLFSLARQISSRFSFNVFGGPHYARLHDVIPALPPATGLLPIFNARLHWAGGGELTTRSERTVIQLTAERQITDGGGLLGPVTSSAVSLDVRRQLPARWEGLLGVSYGHNRNLDTGLPLNRIQSTTARFGLERAWTPSLTAGFGYEFLLQRTQGTGSSFANVYRNRVYLRLEYRLRETGLGR